MTPPRRARVRGFPLGALCLAMLAAPLAASGQQEVSTTEGAIFLLLPVGAKAVALGRSMTALPGAESVWWNPAGLGETVDDRFLVYRGEDLAGVATAASLILAQPGAGSVGLSYMLMDVGDQELTDEEGNVLGTLSFRNHLGVATVAGRFGDRLSLGFNVKVVQSRVSCRGQCLDAGVAGTTFAVDLGAQVSRVAGLPLRLGALLAHLGPDLQFINKEQADPLPTRLRLAAAYEVLGHFVETDELKMEVAVELENRWKKPGSPSIFVGSEVMAGTSDLLFVRAGYVLNAQSQVDGAAVGVGLRYERFDLGIAKSLATSTLTGDAEPVHITFGFVF